VRLIPSCFSLCDFIHRPLEHQHARADDEQGPGDFERAVWVGRGVFFCYVSQEFEQSDAAPIRREALDHVILILWGTLALMMGLVHSVQQLYVLRFVLDCGGRIFPGVALY